MGVLVVSDEDITKCQEWIQTTTTTQEEGAAPCPMTTTAGENESWLDKDFAPSTKELMDIRNWESFLGKQSRSIGGCVVAILPTSLSHCFFSLKHTGATSAPAPYFLPHGLAQ
jgi:hypothetical protein